MYSTYQLQGRRLFSVFLVLIDQIPECHQNEVFNMNGGSEHESVKYKYTNYICSMFN